MLSWTFFFPWALLGVSRAQVEGAMPSVKEHPTTQLQYREKRDYISYGAAKELEDPVEIIPSSTTDENASAPMSRSTNTAEPSSVTRPAVSNWHLRKTLGTPVQQGHKMNLLTRTVQETNGVSPPEANLEDFGTSVACRVLTKGHICVKNTVQEILGGSQIETGRQENGSAQLPQNQTHPRRVPFRPGYRPKPNPPKPNRPPSWNQPFKPYRPPPLYQPFKPKPKPDPNNNPMKPSNTTNSGVSAHWTASIPVLAGLLVVHRVF